MKPITTLFFSLLTIVSFAQISSTIETPLSITASGSSPHPSAILDINSGTKGLLIPRMNTVARDSITSPETGLLIFQTDGVSGFYYYNGTAWVSLNSGIDADSDPTNELQDISLTGTNLALSNGSTLDLAVIQDGVNDADNDPINETNTTLNLSGTNLSVTDAGGTLTADLSSLQAITVLEDADTDTKVLVEKTPDEDVIHFEVTGEPTFSMKRNGNGDGILATNSSSVIMGSSSWANNTGDSNVFIGRDAARLNSTGRRNVVMGSQAGYGLTEGSLNVMIGTIAGRDNVLGSRNVFIGDSAGSGPSGNSCVYVGTASGANSGGDNNIFIGDSAGASNIAGGNNILLGVGAGLSATGSNNIFLGYFSGSTETADNRLYIENSGNNSPLIYGEFDNDLVRVNGSFNATGLSSLSGGINFPNSFSPDNAYVGDAGNFITFGHSGNSEDFLGYTGNNFYFRDSPGGGDAAQPGIYAAAYNTYSSKRWKHSVKNIENALAIVMRLRGTRYIWNEDQGGHADFGFIAEEVHTVLPEIAVANIEGQIDGVQYGKLTPYLVEAIKEQQEVIVEQAGQIEELEERMARMEKLLQNREE